MNNGAFASEPFIQLWCMISTGRINTVLDDLNGKVLWFPLRHRVRALIFVCQQWHAISCRGTGAKTQVLILSTLMALMASKMRGTACHWKCNALYGMTSWTGGGNTMFICFYGGGRSTLNTELSENDSRKDSFTLTNRKKLQSPIYYFCKYMFKFSS